MQKTQIYGEIDQICVIGHGLIGRGTVPLIKKHFIFTKMTIIDPSPTFLPDADPKVQFLKLALTHKNYNQILNNIFKDKKGFVVNLSIGVASYMLMKYCQEKQLLYIDSSTQDVSQFYHDQESTLEDKCNYNMRQHLHGEIKKLNAKTTAVSCCGANPGMVCWLVKQALLDIARDTGFKMDKQPTNRKEWGQLMNNLGVKGLHISERDSQVTNEIRPPGQFWNTWSIDGFLEEGIHQPCELGWGTFEKWMPQDAFKHEQGCQSAIYMKRPGMNVMVKSWCPSFGPFGGMLISHEQAISIADFYTIKDQNNKVVYRPTCAFAYQACPDAYLSSLQCLGSGKIQEIWKVKNEEIVSGSDEVGVLLYGHAKNAYWLGSQLNIHDARKRAKYHNATSLQVSSAVIAGMAWALAHPQQGFTQCDAIMDFKKCIQVIEPYIAPIKGYYTDWTPLHNKSNFLVEDQFDLDDPWQFKNIIISK